MSDTTPIAARSRAHAPWPVLIVDDDVVVLTITRLTLQHLVVHQRSLAVTTCRSAAEARRVLADQTFAVVIVDLVMETTTAGLDLIQHIREDPRHRHTPIVVRSGEEAVASRGTVMQRDGVADYWPKADPRPERIKASVAGLIRTYAAGMRSEDPSAGAPDPGWSRRLTEATRRLSLAIEPPRPLGENAEFAADLPALLLAAMGDGPPRIPVCGDLTGLPAEAFIGLALLFAELAAVAGPTPIAAWVYREDGARVISMDAPAPPRRLAWIDTLAADAGVVVRWRPF